MICPTADPLMRTTEDIPSLGSMLPIQVTVPLSVITVSADVLIPKGAMPSARTVLT